MQFQNSFWESDSPGLPEPLLQFFLMRDKAKEDVGDEDYDDFVDEDEEEEEDFGEDEEEQPKDEDDFDDDDDDDDDEVMDEGEDI